MCEHAPPDRAALHIAAVHRLKRMNILFVNTLYAPEIGGGAEVVLGVLASGLQARGHAVTVATTSSSNGVTLDRVDGVQVIRLPLHNIYRYRSDAKRGAAERFIWHALDIYNPVMAQSLGRVIETVDPEVVCFHNVSGFSGSAWGVARRKRKPCVQVLHDYYNLCPRTQLYRSGQNCVRRCSDCRGFRLGRANSSSKLNAVIGVSHAVLQTHLDHGLFRHVRLRRVVNNALPEGQAVVRNYPATASVFGFIGTLSDHKGVREMLLRFSRLQRDRTLQHIRVLVAGGGDASYVSELRGTFASSGIEFLGRVSPESFYSRVHAVVVPSLWREPFPTVVAEAQLFGLPVIGTKRGGIPEMVTHELNGLLYEPDSQSEFESSVRRLAETPGLVHSLGGAARVNAARFANVGRMLDEHLVTYQAAIDMFRSSNVAQTGSAVEPHQA